MFTISAYPLPFLISEDNYALKYAEHYNSNVLRLEHFRCNCHIQFKSTVINMNL